MDPDESADDFAAYGRIRSEQDSDESDPSPSPKPGVDDTDEVLVADTSMSNITGSPDSQASKAIKKPILRTRGAAPPLKANENIKHSGESQLVDKNMPRLRRSKELLSKLKGVFVDPSSEEQPPLKHSRSDLQTLFTDGNEAVATGSGIQGLQSVSPKNGNVTNPKPRTSSNPRRSLCSTPIYDSMRSSPSGSSFGNPFVDGHEAREPSSTDESLFDFEFDTDFSKDQQAMLLSPNKNTDDNASSIYSRKSPLGDKPEAKTRLAKPPVFVDLPAQYSSLFSSSPVAESTPRVRLEPRFEPSGRRQLRSVSATEPSIFGDRAIETWPETRPDSQNKVMASRGWFPKQPTLQPELDEDIGVGVKIKALAPKDSNIETKSMRSLRKRPSLAKGVDKIFNTLKKAPPEPEVPPLAPMKPRYHNKKGGATPPLGFSAPPRTSSARNKAHASQAYDGITGPYDDEGSKDPLHLDLPFYQAGNTKGQLR